MRAPIASQLLIAALAVACSATAVQAQKKAGQITRQIQPAYVQRAQAAAAAAKTGGVVTKVSLSKLTATDKMPIYWSDSLLTEKGGRMRAQLEDGSILSVGPESHLIVTELNAHTGQSTLELKYGKVRAQVVKFTRPDSKFEVRTSTAVCGVLGTDEYVELTSPISTLVVNLSDPNSRSQVEVRNSDTKVAGTVLLNPGQATTVDQGKPPTGARPATGSEVNRAQQDTASSQEPISTPTLQVTSGSVTPGDVPSVQIEAGAQITLDARMSSSGAGSFSGFLWRIPRRNVQSNEPYLVLATNDWTPGTYDGTLTITTTQNKTATARFNIVVTQSIAGRGAPEEAIQALARAYESLQVRNFLSYFHQQNYAGYASLEETVTRSFANIAENRVYLRKANGTVSGNTATYQVEFEIRFLPKASALPQSGIPALTPTAAGPRMYAAMGGGGQRAAATASISGSTGAVATFVTLSGLTAPLKLYVNTGAGTTYSFQNLPPGKYLITPSRNGFSFNPPSRTVDLTEAGLTGVDFAAAAETQVVRETVTVQMQYVPNASWYITSLSGPIGSAGLVGIPGVGAPDQGLDTTGSGQQSPGSMGVADFQIAASPENLPPIARGGPGALATITVTPLNGFNGNCTLSWILPTGISVSPAGPQVVALTNAPVSRTFTLSADATAPLAASVALLAESGNLKRQATSNLTIYSLTLSPAGGTPVNVFVGGSVSLPVNVTTAPGVTIPIAVTASGPGIASSTATVNGNGTATLNITTTGPATGPVQASVTATAQGLPAAAIAVPLNRVAPFSLSGGGAVSFMAGSQGSASFQVQFAPGFTGPVVVTPPSLANVTFTPATINLTGSGSAVFDVTAAAPFTGVGSFTAAAGTFTATGSVNFSIVPAVDFNLAAGSLAVMAGQSGSVSVNVNQTKGSPIPILVSIGDVSSDAISVSGGGTLTGSGTISLLVSVRAGAAPGSARFTVTAEGGGITRTAWVSVTITAQPPVVFSVSGGSLTLVAGAGGKVTVQVSQSAGPPAVISVTASGYDSSKISVSGGGTVAGSGSVSFSIAALPTALPGPTSFTVTATSGGVTQTASVSVNITPAASFSITGGSVTVTAGAPPAGVAVQVTQTVGDPVPISVSASGVDGSKISVSGGGTVTGSGSVALSVSALPTAAAGVTSFTVTAAYGGLVQTATVSVAILAAPEFTISGASVNLLPGDSTTVSIPVKQTAGAPVAINVTTGGVDGSKISVSGGGTASGGSVSLTIAALPTAAAGVTTFTVTASYGSISHSVTVTVTIGSFTLTGPGSLSLAEGGNASVNLSLTPASFAGSVTLTSSATPGLTVSGPTSLTGGTPGAYTVTAAPGAPDGTVTFTASVGSLTSSVTTKVTVTDAVESASATGGTGFATGTVPVQVSISRAAGYIGPVTAELSGAPSGITISPSSGTIDAAKTSFAFTANIASGTAAGGTVTFKAYAPGSTRSKSASAALTVVPAFTLTGGGSLTVTAGSSGSTSVSVNFAQSYSGPVSLSAGSGAGAVTISPSSLTASGSASVSVAVPAAAAAGAQSLTVTASGAGITQTLTMTVIVTVPPPPPPPTPTPSSITIVSGNNQSAQVGTALPNPLVVQMNGTGGAPLSGSTVNFSVSPSGSATLSASSATTGSNGQAQVTATLGTIAGPLTITASVSGVTTPATFSFTATAGPAASLSIVSGNNQLALGGTALANALVVKVADQYGNPVSGVAVTFTPSTGSGTVSPASAATGSNGQAQATMTLATTPSLPVTVSASASGVAAPVVFNISVAPPGPAAVVVVSGNNQSGQVSTALASPLVVRVNDSVGNPVSGTSVAFVATGGAALSAASVTTGSNGQAQVTVTLGTIAGPVTVTASVSGVTTPATFNLTGTAGPAASLSIVSGNTQSGLGGTALVNPLVVKVADQYGNPVSGVAVTFTPRTGSGTVSPASATTGTNGQAFVIWTLGAVAGSNGVTVSIPSASSIPAVTFTATGSAAVGTVSVGSGQAPPNFSASVPVMVNMNGLTADTLSFSVKVTPVGAAPAFTVPPSGSNFSFTPAGGFPAPSFIDTLASPDTISLGFINISPGLSGTVTVGQLQIKVPATAQSGQTYTMQVTGASATLGGVTALSMQPGPNGTLTATASGPPSGGGIVSAGPAAAGFANTLLIPITLTMSSGKSVDTLSFSVSVAGGSGNPPALSANLGFNSASGLPAPGALNGTTSFVSVAWLNPRLSPPLGPGSTVLGNVVMTIPTGVVTGQTYMVHVTGANGTLSGATVPIAPGPDVVLTMAATKFQLMSRSAKPDLLIPADEFTYSPAFPREGDTVKFRVHVRNRGAADARNAQVALMMQDKILASEKADVAAGRTATVELEWKAERVTGRDLRLAIRTSDQPDDNPPLVTLALRNFAVERRGGLASARRERVTLDAANDGCVGLRLLSASRSSCGGSADVEFTPAITARGRISLRLFTSEGGVVDLGAQPLTAVAAAPDAGYQPNAELEQGRTYALKTRNRYALFRVVRISSTVNPRLVSDEVQRRERQRGGRVVNDDLLRDMQDSRALDRALDAARITIYLEMLVQEDGSANFQ